MAEFFTENKGQWRIVAPSGNTYYMYGWSICELINAGIKAPDGYPNGLDDEVVKDMKKVANLIYNQDICGKMGDY